MVKKSKDQYKNLISDIAAFIENGRKLAVQCVDTSLVATYWLVGRRIIVYEQKGKKRAKYGTELLKKISNNLIPRFGKGFTVRNLEQMRQFYLTYSKISHTACAKLPKGSSSEKSHTVCAELSIRPKISIFEIYRELSQRFPLAWSKYRLIMRIDDAFKREFYEAECIRGNWSVRQLDRQIQSALYERTALSKRKLAVIAKAHKKPIVLKPQDEMKNPIILEFLGLKDEYSESDLEEALIKHLEHFLLELGVGFTFVARQKTLTIGSRHYRIDLLLYHRILRCLICVDLKVGELSHSDAGQMNLYLNYLKAKEKMPKENNPIGLILCLEKDRSVAEYALGGMSNKIFASKYRLKLPDAKVLQEELEHERQRLIEMNLLEGE